MEPNDYTNPGPQLPSRREAESWQAQQAEIERLEAERAALRADLSYQTRMRKQYEDERETVLGALHSLMNAAGAPVKDKEHERNMTAVERVAWTADKFMQKRDDVGFLSTDVEQLRAELKQAQHWARLWKAAATHWRGIMHNAADFAELIWKHQK